MDELDYDSCDLEPGAQEDEDVYLRPGDAVDFLGKIFVVQGKSREIRGYVFADQEDTAMQHPMSNRAIKQRIQTGKMRVVPRGEFGLPLGIRESLRRTLSAFDAVERREMFRRLRYCRALDELPADFSRSEAALRPVCNAVAQVRGDAGPHDLSTVYRWWMRWTMAGRDARALAPSHRRKGNR